jgi:hypothetical protein
MIRRLHETASSPMTTVEIENSNPTRRRRRRKDAARYVRETYGVPCTEGHLAKLAVKGGGPPYEYYGRFPVYTDVDLDLWVESRMSEKVHSTAALPPRDGVQRGRPRKAELLTV